MYSANSMQPTWWFAFPVLTLIFCFGVSGCAHRGSSQSQPVTVPEIIQMSREGVAPKAIIQRIRESGTVYRLSASQLADIRDAGVDDTVINYMQNTYLNAVTRDQALQDWQFWHSGPGDYWYGGIPFGWPYEREFYEPHREFMWGEPRGFERGEGVEGHELQPREEPREREESEEREGGVEHHER